MTTKKERPEVGVPPGVPTTTDADEACDPHQHTRTSTDVHTSSLVVTGRPVPFARPRFNGKRSFDDPAYAAAKQALALLARNANSAAPLLSPVSVSLVFVFARAPSPKAKSATATHHQTTPDVDNLAKTVLDALNGVWWADDRQVFRLSAEKRWGQHDRTEIVARWEVTTTTNEPEKGRRRR